MKILVTGGAGFLGTHLCESLLIQEHEVLCLDNLYTGSLENIKKFRDQKNFHFINADVTESFDYEVDGIFNLACPASPIHYQVNPITTTRTNMMGALNVLELARKNGVQVLQASTSEVYGDPKVSPQTEEYWGNVNPVGLRSCYDEGKRVAETLFMDYHLQYAVDTKIARIFNTYGPNMAKSDGRVVSNFIVQALTNKQITIYGDGSQTRSFCFVSDTILGLEKLFFSHNIHTPINIGNPQPITMLQLASEIIELTGSKSKIIYLDLPSDDPTQRVPDITQALKLLDWQPSIDREVGLAKTIEYFKELIN